jgi:hypothetical protein
MFICFWVTLLCLIKANGSFFDSKNSTNIKIVSFVEVTRDAFLKHPLHSYSHISQGDDLIPYLSKLANSKACENKPVFMSMARVQSHLYWQLIEGFFHSMFYFGHLGCSVMICVTDPKCVDMCKESGFPCFDFQHPNPSTHVMEQVADLKLHHVGKALEKGIHVLLLDLDVGFIRDPWLLFDGFLENPYEQVRAQMDVGSCMNKSAGMTWFTQPLTNFGVFLVKSHPYSIKAFKQANKEYRRVPMSKRMTVATDQNVVSGAIKWARWRFGYNFSYFSIGFDLCKCTTHLSPLIHGDMFKSIHHLL